MVRGNTAHTTALLPVTDTTATTHLVTEPAMTIGRRFGRYVACCGAEVLAASLAEPERGYCRACARWRAEQ